LEALLRLALEEAVIFPDQLPHVADDLGAPGGSKRAEHGPALQAHREGVVGETSVLAGHATSSRDAPARQNTTQSRHRRSGAMASRRSSALCSGAGGSDADSRMDRREFLQAGTLSALLPAAPRLEAAAGGEARVRGYRRLGRTGFEVS